MGKNNKKKEKKTGIEYFFSYIHNWVVNLNQSKIFTGLMIIILNISSRFVTIKLSKSMESYLKYTFSRQILIFAIAWMGTRDIYIALIITLLFILFMDCLFNEECKICVLPKQFTNYHIELTKQKEKEEKNINDQKEEITELQIKQAKETLEKASKNSVSANTSLLPLSLM